MISSAFGVNPTYRVSAERSGGRGCEGFRMTPHHDTSRWHWDRRPKASREGTRGVRVTGAAARTRGISTRCSTMWPLIAWPAERL